MMLENRVYDVGLSTVGCWDFGSMMSGFRVYDVVGVQVYDVSVSGV